ncbi:TPA: hypothetical protein EYP66_06480, partial [Candidatus Poribacteria bacterium]|nr:hypothetical protein [Candidatus Poribacteria bacterium]
MIYLSLWKKLCFFLTSIFLLFPITVFADAVLIEEYRVEAYRTYESIELDGEFNEFDWQKAKPISQFVQVEPDEGKPITQPMEVRVLYDDENIYLGFTCFDSEISKLVANEMRRDARDLHENDNVYVLLDTYNDRRSGFFFRINALGAMQDSAITNSGDSMNRNWDAVWACRAKIKEDRWTVEVAIPFSQLRFNHSDKMTWGMNVGREIIRNQETSIWVPVPKSYGGMAKYRTSNLGVLAGLEGIYPSRHLEVLPYILPGVSRTSESETEVNHVFDIGLDVKYGITSNLTGDLTFNTDFAQVEADEERVNLTRFSLFFPEKRPFFLEGAGMFDFGIPRTSFRRPPPLLLFYSRRIGLEEGHAVPIITGGKVTGKIGPYNVGLLNVLTDEFHTDKSVTDPDEIVAVPRTNYSVLRVKRDIFRGSSIGLIAINKQDSQEYNRASGFDFSYRPIDNLDVLGMWARTFEKGASEQNSAWYFGSRWRTNLFRLEGSYTDIGENFNPEVGFVRRKGVRRIRGETRYTPWPGVFGIRRIWFGPEFDYILNQDNRLETSDISLVNWFEFERGGWLSFFVQRTFERLDEDFEIREGIIIPADEYNFNSFRSTISTDESRMISGEFGVNFGDFFNGRRRGFDIEASFKPSGRFSLESQYEFNRVILPDGSFNANAFSSRVNYSFSTTLFAKLFAQWNNDSNIISTNFLLNYIYRPGSNLFFVFNQTYDSGGNKIELVDSTLVAKITYWW